MKVSNLFVQTLREVPNDATLTSHQLLLRGGYIKQLAQGIYSLFPMGKRVMDKIEKIIREEMHEISSQEIDLPVSQPAGIWKESGRYENIDELLKFSDRNSHDMVLAMTHEEAVTDLVRNTLKSYKQLPFSLYQLQTKFRDEIRSRGGLIRVREFVMKDAYSFHASNQCLDDYYEKAKKAYIQIFNRAGIEPIVVQSDTGMMGGKIAHEFMLESSQGEDYLILCRTCGYQANAEIAKFTRENLLAELLPIENVETPTQESIADVADFLKLEKSKCMKCVFYEDSEGQLYTAVTLGHLEVSEIKLKNFLKRPDLQVASAERIIASAMVPGFASPINSKNNTIIVDESVTVSSNLVAGANKKGWHTKNVNYGRDFEANEIADIAQAETGCICCKCAGKLEATRGIEIGNIFKLGTKFTDAMECKFLDEQGKSQSAIMGCYGIGVGRLMASVIEQHHDDWGVIWPKEIAPFQVHLVSLGKDELSLSASAKVYQELSLQGVEVLWDDRNERPGVKFKDADLWGIPIRLGVGGKALKEGKVEWKIRGSKNFDKILPTEVLQKVQDFYS
jgi:prolyl-tRNA synthetase